MPFLHENAGTVGADLTGRIEIAEHRAADSAFDIGIVKHDQRRFATEFHRHMLEMPGGGGRHLTAGGHRAGERDLGDIRVVDQKRAGIAITLNDVEQALGQPCLDQDFGNLQSAERVFSEGLKTMALPATSAGAAFQQAICCG